MKITTRPYAKLRLEAPDFKNPRQHGPGLDPEEIRQLAIDIGRGGMDYPLRVTAADVILGGQRRYLAIDLVIHWRREIFARVDPSEVDRFDAAARDLAAGVPCLVVESTDPTTWSAKALGDNVKRVDMSSYDVAAAIVALMDKPHGKSGRWIAREIQRSTTFVSRAASTFRNACDELRDAWAADRLPFDRAMALSELPHDQQREALARPAARPTKSHGRPGIDAVKERLAHVRGLPPKPLYDKSPEEVARDVLAWVAGEPPTPFIAALLGVGPS